MGTKRSVITCLVIAVFFYGTIFSGNALSLSRSSNDIFDAIIARDLDKIRNIIKKDKSAVNSVYEGKNRKLYGYPALYVAARIGDEEIVELLLQHGADPNAYCKKVENMKDRENNSLLIAVFSDALPHRAKPSFELGVCKGNYKAVIELLLAYGADPNVRYIEGKTPSHIAAHFSCSEICKILSKYGADFCIKNDEGKEPHIYVLGLDESYDDTYDLLQLAKEKSKYIKMLCTLIQGKQEEELKEEKRKESLQKLQELVISGNTPVCLKFKALVFLVKFHRKNPDMIPIYKIKEYYAQVPFTYTFFKKNILLEFALEHRQIEFKDIRGRKIQDAIQECFSREAVSTIFSKSGRLYRSKNIKQLLEIDKEESHDSVVSKAFVKKLKKERSAGKKALVKEFYKTYEVCRDLRIIFPPGVAGHILGFMGN